jgi:hypothetical protein
MNHVRLAVVALIVAGCCAALAAGQKFLNVSVRQGEIRATPSPFGAILGAASYGDRVEILEENGAWLKVTASAGLTGWMHSSSLTKQRIKMLAGDTSAGTGASSGEMTLAGKGFSQEVEAAYKNKNPNMNFTWVDRMEKFKPSPQQIQTFLKDGALKEGGAK